MYFLLHSLHTINTKIGFLNIQNVLHILTYGQIIFVLVFFVTVLVKHFNGVRLVFENDSLSLKN